MASLPIHTVQQRRFDGGMVTDPRDPTSNKYRYCANFDCLTNPYKMSPYHDSENGDTNSSTDMIQAYCVALGASSTYRLFGLGVVSGTGLAEVYFKNLGTGGSSDLSDAVWSTTGNNQSTVGSTSFNLFCYYKTMGLIYGATAGNTIWAYDPTGGTAFNDSASGTSKSISYTNISQGIVHSMNDTMFFGYDNKIAQNNAGTWNTTALTLPDYLYVTGVCEYGNYLAIIMAPLSGVGNSKVFLWDMIATTWNIMVDCYDGIGKIIGTVNGVLVTGSIAADSSRIITRITFREYTGAGMEAFAVFEGSQSDQLSISAQKTDERLLFQMRLTQEGSVKAGIWSISGTGKSLAVLQERTVNNNTALAVGDIMNGFYKVGDYTFQSFTVSSTWTMSKTNDQASYTATSIMETSINPEMPEGDKIQLKQLLTAGLMYEYMPSGGQAVLKYRVDNSSGSWTTIFTETNTGITYTEPYPNAQGTSFTKGKEYEFRIESTGGCEITGLMYKYEVLQSNV